MSSKLEAYLQDILDSIDKIEIYIKDSSLDDLLKDPLRTDALALNLLVIGEAVGQLPKTVRAKHPDVPWRQIVGLRNIIAHQYFRFDLELIWNVVESELGTLKKAVQEIQAELND